MLFSFFKNHERQSAVHEHLGGFQNQFTENQKKAIMCSLLIIANSDGKYHRTEEQFFEEIATILGYRYHLKSNYFNDVMSLDREKLFQLLDSLTESQKDWYIFTAFGMIHADGQALEVEFKYLAAFFDEMGITPQRFDRVLKETQFLLDKFM